MANPLHFYAGFIKDVPSAYSLTLCEVSGHFVTKQIDLLEPDDESSRELARAKATWYPPLDLPHDVRPFTDSRTTVSALKTVSNTSFISTVVSWAGDIYDNFFGLSTLWAKLTEYAGFSANVGPPISGRIRAVAFHPHRPLLAVATHQEVFLYDASKKLWIPRSFVSTSQDDITSLAWRPYAGAQLAVGSKAGVVVWSFDLSGITADRISATLKFIDVALEVTAIAWISTGQFLAFASRRGKSIVVWEASTGLTSSVPSFGRYVSCLAWSRDGRFLAAGAVDGVLRLWATSTWSAERWTDFKGPIKRVIFSPDCRRLVVAVHGQTILTCFDVVKSPAVIATTQDFAACEMQGQTVGGTIQDVVWDDSGERVVVVFDHSPLQLVCSVITTPIFQLIPSGFVRGFGDEVVATTFGQLAGHDVICSAMSNSRISLIPLYFMSQQKLQQQGTILQDVWE